MRFSCALWRVIRFPIYIDFGGGSPVRTVKFLLAWAAPLGTLSLQVPCCEESNSRGRP